MKLTHAWTYIREGVNAGRWACEIAGQCYFVLAYRRDLWHIEDKLANAIRNRKTNPADYNHFVFGADFKHL